MKGLDFVHGVLQDSSIVEEPVVSDVNLQETDTDGQILRVMEKEPVLLSPDVLMAQS